MHRTRLALLAGAATLSLTLVLLSSGGPRSGWIVGHPVGYGHGITMPFSRARIAPGVSTPRQKPDPGEQEHSPKPGSGAPNSLLGGINPNAPSPAAGVNFLGIQYSDTAGYVPPDSMGSVGPTQIVVAANGAFKVFDKSGNLQFTVDDLTFWSSVRGGQDTSDPEVEYDRLSGRWIFSAINLANSNNRIMLAVSSGPTITNTSSFTFFQFANGLSSGTMFADYPQMGVDKNAVYIGTNDFGSSSFNTAGFVIRKSDLLNGTLTVTTFPNLAGSSTGPGPFTPQPATNWDPSATEGYFIGVDNAVSSKLDVRRVSNPGGTPSISSDLSISVPTTTSPIDVPASGTSTKLDGLDDRLMEAMIARDPASGQLHLWTAHNIQVDSSGNASGSGGRDGLRWYEIGNLSTTPSLVQSGTVFDSASSSPAFYWIPSIAANGQGRAAIASSVAGSGRFPSIAAAWRFPGDAAGTMSTPAVLQAGTSYNNTITNPQRWGDYSQTVVDPTDDMTFWTFQEYANSSNSWGVRVIQIKAPPPATPSAASPSSVSAGQSSVNVQITGTSSNGSAFFDPGADSGGPGWANRIQASASGGVTVNSVTYTDSTHVTLNLNTSGASSGAKNVTITNPDGQSAGGTGMITIGSGSSTTNTLTVAKAGSGSGTVTSSPAGIDCGSACSHDFDSGTSVTLTAAPASGSSFGGWSGDCTGTGTCTLSMSAGHSVTATFATASPSNQTLTVAKAGSGSGTVSSSPSGINCGSTCSHDFASGTSVTLTAAAASGSTFSGWSGDCSGTGACTLTMNASHSVTATFTQNSPPPPPPPPPSCVVPDVRGMTLGAAQGAIGAANCSTGAITWVHSWKKKGTVLAQSPPPGKILSQGSSVRLAVSAGKHKHHK